MDNSINFEFDKLTLLEFDNIALCFPQNNILTIESLDQIDSVKTTEKSSGTLTYNLAELPVYTFNHDLALQAHTTTGNRFCIGIKHSQENKSFAVMCDAVNQYQLEDKSLSTNIPALMHNPDSPIMALSSKEDKLLLLSTAESMYNYINALETEHHEDIENA